MAASGLSPLWELAANPACPPPDVPADGARRGDLYALRSSDFPFVQHRTRVHDACRLHGHRWYLDPFERRRIPFVPTSGPVPARVAARTALLKARPGARRHRRARARPSTVGPSHVRTPHPSHVRTLAP